MEISNNTASSQTIFLPRKQENNSARMTVLPPEQLKQEQQDSTTENTSGSPAQTGSNIEQISAIQPRNIIRLHQQSHSGRPNGATNYTVVAHQQQLARHAEQAIASYNSIENSQYGQELVNRIELLV